MPGKQRGGIMKLPRLTTFPLPSRIGEQRSAMKLSREIACILLLVCLFAFPVVLTAQAQESTPPGTPRTDQEKRGEALFLKNCALCHIHTAQKARLKIQASSELIGLFRKSSTTEAGVRQRVQQGVPGVMPTFQYALEPKENDDLIAYLKIR
jgi:mono/diheme cytochrome c family protein